MANTVIAYITHDDRPIYRQRKATNDVATFIVVVDYGYADFNGLSPKLNESI